jgi:hypothetical protein
VTATPPDLPAWIAVALCGEEVLRRTPAALRKSKSRTLWAVFFFLGAAMLTKIQIVGDFLFHLTGVDDFATLVKHLAGIAAVAMLLRWVTNVVPGRMEGRREPTYRRAISSNPRRIATWAAVVVITAIFPLSQRRMGNEEDSDFIFVQAGHLWGSLHLLLFYTYLVFGLVCASLMCAAAAREPSARGAFKYGMQAVSLGTAVGCIYGIIRSGYLISRLFDKPFLGGDGFVDMVSSFSLIGCILLVVCGMNAPRLELVDRAIKVHSAINDLRPLWTILTRAVPTVVYNDENPVPGRTGTLVNHLGEFWSWRHLDTRLNKRINEIFDAAMALAPYVGPELRQRAETAGRELRLAPYSVTAFLLREGIRRKKAGEAPCEDVTEPLFVAGRDSLATTAQMLPIGRSMNDTAALGRLHRMLSSTGASA